MTAVLLEPAGPGDAVVVAAVLRESRTEAMPWLAVVLTPEEDLARVRSVLLARHEVTVAREHDDGAVVGVLATSPGWVDQLYVLPAHQRRGVGRGRSTSARASWCTSRPTAPATRSASPTCGTAGHEVTNVGCSTGSAAGHVGV